MNDLLSKLPNMNSLIEHPSVSILGAERAKKASRDVLDELRRSIISKALQKVPDLDECASMVYSRASNNTNNLRSVVNATGVILHTNLGRAPLGDDILKNVIEACSGYCNLEYDTNTGKRGSRYAHVEELICALTGAEAAVVTNNNAAAMVLILGTLARDKKVAISRGELVEIGGSFRMPDVIVQSGAELVEIGSTNKTKLSDYIDAVENKGAEVLLKVHTSNYEVVGFTQSVDVSSLAKYGKSIGMPVVYDVGSCFLIDTELFGFSAGKTEDAITSGADIICFSGDKLLGSIQSGIIAGRADLISAMKKHPLARAFRPDKLTLTVLESTLRLYQYPQEAAERIPILSMLFAQSGNLKKRADEMASRISSIVNSWVVEVCPVSDETGGGALPNIPLPGWAVSIKPSGMSVNELENHLRKREKPIIIRIFGDAALLSMRTLCQSDDNVIYDAFSQLNPKHQTLC